LLAACVGAVVLPSVTFLAEQVDYVGGAVAAIPLIDLLPLLFISSREKIQKTMVGDFIGQCGAVAGIYTAFYLSHFTEVDVRLIVLGSLSVAFAVNAAAYLILRCL